MDVDEMLKGVDPKLRALTQALRGTIKRALPSAVEQVKWGNPVYTVNGKNVACIMHYSDHVNLGFFMGAKLKSKKLEGTGKGLRHLKVRSKADMDEKEFGRLLKEAAALVE
ncbi:MAG: DUF1801 domain-containing protein [Nitrososphaerales archaeon]|nr:DUF1801 domain-containing protein [Nitrososphaerales archaeon]